MNRSRRRDGITEHRYVEDRLSAYLDGQLTPREHKAVRQHLTTCQECQWNLSTLQQTVQWTGALPNIPAPRVFTIPAPAQAIPAPRRSWGFVPLLQGATALVALLLVFMLAGDYLLSGLQPANAPQQAAMVEQAASAVQVTAVAQEAEEALLLEGAAMDEMAVSEPTPSTMPQMDVLTAEPALGEAEQPRAEAAPVSDDEGQAMEEAAVAAADAPEAEEAQAMAVEPPGVKESGLTTAMKAVEAPATLPPEASVLESAGAAGAGELAKATVVAALPPTELPPVVAPTAVAQAPAPAPVLPEAPPAVLRQPSASLLRLVEVALAILVVLLGTLAVVATILQRKLR